MNNLIHSLLESIEAMLIHSGGHIDKIHKEIHEESTSDGSE
jgi:hypothetical protein